MVVTAFHRKGLKRERKTRVSRGRIFVFFALFAPSERDTESQQRRARAQATTRLSDLVLVVLARFESS